MNKITCARCKEEKTEDQFKTISHWKRLSDGTVKRYPETKAKQCNTCINWRDRLTRMKPKKRMWHRKETELMGLTKKERDLIQAMNPKLHPYAFKTPTYEFTT